MESRISLNTPCRFVNCLSYLNNHHVNFSALCSSWQASKTFSCMYRNWDSSCQVLSCSFSTGWKFLLMKYSEIIRRSNESLKKYITPASVLIRIIHYKSTCYCSLSCWVLYLNCFSCCDECSTINTLWQLVNKIPDSSTSSTHTWQDPNAQPCCNIPASFLSMSCSHSSTLITSLDTNYIPAVQQFM